MKVIGTPSGVDCIKALSQWGCTKMEVSKKRCTVPLCSTESEWCRKDPYQKLRDRRQQGISGRAGGDDFNISRDIM